MSPHPATYLDKLEFKINTEKRCTNCKHYGFKVRQEDLWTYCESRKEWFPTRIHPGDYVCESWEAKENVG